MEGDESDDGLSDAGANVVAATVGTASVLATLGGDGTLAQFATGLAPSLVYATWKLADGAVAKRRQRAERAADVAARSLGGLHIFRERVESDPVRAELLARVIEAAGRATLGEKVRALGRVLADGLRNDKQLDMAFALAAALDDIEGVHVLLLKYLADNPQVPQSMRGKNYPGPHGWEIRELRQVQPDVADLVEPVIAVLNRHGLLSTGGGATTLGSVGPTAYRASPLGERCLSLLHGEEGQRNV